MIVKKTTSINKKQPFLVRLDTLTKYRMYVDNLRDKFCIAELDI